jgi:hypothetical protein
VIFVSPTGTAGFEFNAQKIGTAESNLPISAKQLARIREKYAKPAPGIEGLDSVAEAGLSELLETCFGSEYRECEPLESVRRAYLAMNRLIQEESRMRCAEPPSKGDKASSRE